MKIEFNTNDYNLDKIRRESKLFSLNVDHDYKVYGLAEEKNPVILIEYDFERQENEEDGLYINRDHLFKFFKSNGMNIKFKDLKDYDNKKIYLGFRRGLRRNVSLCSATLSTIIYFMEGRLDLKPSFKCLGIPKKFTK